MIDYRTEEHLRCFDLFVVRVSRPNLAEGGHSNFITRSIGNTNGLLRVVFGHFLYINFIYAIGLGCTFSHEAIFAFFKYLR